MPTGDDAGDEDAGAASLVLNTAEAPCNDVNAPSAVYPRLTASAMEATPLDNAANPGMVGAAAAAADAEAAAATEAAERELTDVGISKDADVMMARGRERAVCPLSSRVPRSLLPTSAFQAAAPPEVTPTEGGARLLLKMGAAAAVK